jgi:branched-chain amino acid transport system permease protein
MRQTEYWRALLGAIILFLVLMFPMGIVGTTAAVFGRFGARAKPRKAS